MAMIFLSYRRSDSPQACRVYDWLTRRFGYDAVFMDVADIPFATRFTDYIKREIAESSILIALIGGGWQEKLARAEDPVLMEIETAFANNIPVLPVLIGTTPMPNADTLPESIRSIAYQNASIVGVSRDFDTHMQALLPKIESILGAMSKQTVVAADPEVVSRACHAIIRHLGENLYQETGIGAAWTVMSTGEMALRGQTPSLGVTLLLHRVSRLSELLELHFILTFWSSNSYEEQRLAGQVMRQLELTPVISDEFIKQLEGEVGWTIKVRHGDEDARQVWKMVTDQPLRLSLAYIATVSPKPTGQSIG